MTIATSAVDEFRDRLRAAQRRLLHDVAVTDAELATLDVPAVGDRPEEAAADVAAVILSRLEGRARHELEEIDAAQGRLEAGTFGVCERCGRAIPVVRLRALPTARHCRPCQGREEV